MQEVLRCLHTHLSSKLSSQVSSALAALVQLSREHTSALMGYAAFLSCIMDYLEDFTFSQLLQVYKPPPAVCDDRFDASAPWNSDPSHCPCMLQVCELFSTLAVVGGMHCSASHGASKDSTLRDDFQILLRKFARSPNYRRCRVGIVGTVAFVRALGAAEGCTDTPAASRSQCLDSARDLLNNAFDACKSAHPQHRPALYSCLCGSLTAAIHEVRVCSMQPIVRLPGGKVRWVLFSR